MYFQYFNFIVQFAVLNNSD